MIMGIGKTTTEQQQKIHTGEAFEIWQHLVMRYDVFELTDIFANFANDVEFKSLLFYGIKMLQVNIDKIEVEMNNLGIPLPPRPPKSINTPTNTEILRDELMFRTIYMGIQNFLNEHQRTVLMMKNTKLRDMFIKMQKEETLNMFIQVSLYQLQRTGIIMTDPKLRDMFTKMQTSQTELYSKVIIYGKTKGWLPSPPEYKG